MTAASAWTDHGLVVWGGYVYTGLSDEVAQSDGFVLDPESGAWNKTSQSPLTARAGPASAWTGRELLIWGGSSSTDFGIFVDDGAAYNPTTETWRELPPSPLSPRAPLSVWTGRDFLVWGTDVRVANRPRDGAAYNPVSNRWRMIAEAPIELTDATAVWTGKEMIVFGAALHGGNDSETRTAIGAAYNPRTDKWRRLPDSDLSPQASTAAWNGRELIAWDYLNASSAYDPQTDKWRSLPRVPFDDVECSPRSISLRRFVFGSYCGSMTIFDPKDGKWHDVTRHKYVGWGWMLIAADPVILLLGRDVETKAEAMFAYRPPSR